MDINSIDNSNLTLEQRVVLKLAKMGFLTSSGDIQRALKEFQYANYMISPIGEDGSTHPEIDIDNDGIPDSNPSTEDIIENTPGVSDYVDCEDGDHDACDHEPVTPEEIQWIFDNDVNYENTK